MYVKNAVLQNFCRNHDISIAFDFFAFCQMVMETSQTNALIKDIKNLAQRFRRLAEKEPLTEKSVTAFLAILEKMCELLKLMAEEHYETMKVSEFAVSSQYSSYYKICI